MSSYITVLVCKDTPQGIQEESVEIQYIIDTYYDEPATRWEPAAYECEGHFDDYIVESIQDDIKNGFWVADEDGNVVARSIEEFDKYLHSMIPDVEADAVQAYLEDLADSYEPDYDDFY